MIYCAIVIAQFHIFQNMAPATTKVGYCSDTLLFPLIFVGAMLKCIIPNFQKDNSGIFSKYAIKCRFLPKKTSTFAGL